MRVQVDAARRDPAVRRLLADPYALSPDRAAEPDSVQKPPGAGRARPRPGRQVDRAVRHGAVQHPDRAAQQRPAGLGIRPRDALPRGDVRRARADGHRPRRCRRWCASRRPGMAFGAEPAVLDRVLPAPGEGPGAQDRDAGWFRMEVSAADRPRAALPDHGPRPRRPRLRRDRSHARRERARAGPRRRPAARNGPGSPPPPRWAPSSPSGCARRATRTRSPPV